MYLKSLELFGFKSFAPRTVLNFHEGVTCIVGPNGCGKSNVLDAIRWVLGEQSAKALRGGEMSDVIFSGTDSRAALGMAEVAMTFANCEGELGLDWNEVTIARRVFRDGGSEYLLNKTPCRLRDIQQLFMDTGIGRSAYSIMEQGKIDAILSTKPEDRRAIFEEAAGITKYKAQKKEALRKLEATEANLLRLDDIVKEVKRQIGSLQRQAGKARRYQALLSDLRTLETHSAHRQWATQEEQRGRSAEELAALTARQAEGEAEIERQESEAMVQRAALAEIEGRLDTARRAVNDLKARISNHESRLIFNEERADEFHRLAERYGGEVVAAEEKLRTAEGVLHATDAELERITSTLAVELRQMEEKQAATAALTGEKQAAERTISTLTSDAARQEQRISGFRAQIITVTQQRDTAETRLAILSSEVEGSTESTRRLGEQQSSTQAELVRLAQDLEAAQARMGSGESELEQAQAALAGVDRELRTQQRVLGDKEARLEVLHALLTSGEGFSQGTQAVLRGLDRPELFRPAVQGALAQFIEVDPEFVPAVEAALGANMETIVIKDTMVAEAIIQTLTTQKLGKTSLALRDLDTVFSHVESEALKLPEGALDWLIHKVRPQPEMQRLVERLINHTVLVADLATALRIFPQHGSAIVTLQGEVLTGNGILYGGASHQAANSVLERKNQIASLELELATLRAQVAELNAAREAAGARIEAGQLSLDEAREARASLSVGLSSLRSQLGMVERELAEAERKRQSLEWEHGNVESRRHEAAERLEGLETELQGATGQLEALHAQRAEAGAEIEMLRAREGEVLGELNELKIRVATERQRHTSLHHQREPMEARLVELGELIEARRREIETYEQRGAAALAENAEIEANLIDLRERLSVADLDGSRLLDERAAMAAATEQLNNDLRILRQQMAGSHEQRSRLEVRVNGFEMRTTALLEHIQKRYNLALPNFTRDLHALRLALREAQRRQRSGGAEESAAAGEAPAAEAPVEVESFEIEWSRVEQLVSELDQRVDSMGPVNLDAIQEYDELEERHAFLEKQNNDLLNSKNELLEVLQRINKTTRELFATTFEKIRVNFQEMFGELFGAGGKANLLLTDDTDPLESGIDVIAKPPGKQLQSITLLSGGERTMTAVALLFSIYMVKPAPFCVLDEMDAPLDESNISRFIKIVDRFVGQSQFVVISHHKRTIARADALYGVTMEEHGVSKLVGVRFAKREDSHEGSDIIGTDNAAPVPSVAETFGKSGSLASETVQAG